MKKTKKLLTLLIISAIFVLGFGASAYAASTGTVNENGVNVRKGSSTSSGIIKQVDKGQTVTITGTENGFHHVYFPGVDDGYISAQFVTVNNAAAKAAPAAASVSASDETGKVIGTSVNIRSTPSTGGAVLGKAKAGDTFKVLGSQSGWYKISYKDAEAYITGEFLQLANGAGSGPIAGSDDAPVIGGENQVAHEEKAEETIYAIVTSDEGLFLRQLPMQGSKALNALAFGEVIDVVSIDTEWVGVVYEGEHGFVSAEYVMVQRGIKPTFTAMNEEMTQLASQIIEYGKQFLGTPYVYGGTNLNSGVDCSGFVYAVMKKFGVSLNRASYEMAKNGVTVQRSQMKPGDLVFFDTDGNGRISHVGIYIGNKKFIHSSSSKRTWGVTISSLEEAYYNKKFVTANRVL